MNKRVLLIFMSLIFVTKAAAQNFYIEPKVNVAAAAIALFNPAVEIGFGTRSAVQLEYMGAYAKKNYMGTGGPLILNMAIAEYRAYLLNREHKGLFLGFDLGLMQYKTQKYIIPFMSGSSSSGDYDWGFGYVLGLNLGYKFQFKEHWGLEIFAAYGWQHSQHEMHYANGNLRYSMNATAEWTPYKGGVTLSYRFGGK